MRGIPSEKNIADHPARGRSGYFSKIALPPPIDPHVFAARRDAAEEVRQQESPGTPAVKGNDGAEKESSGAVDAATTLDDTTGSLCNRDADGDGRPSSRGGLRVLLRQPPARLEHTGETRQPSGDLLEPVFLGRGQPQRG